AAGVAGAGVLRYANLRLLEVDGLLLQRQRVDVRAQQLVVAGQLALDDGDEARSGHFFIGDAHGVQLADETLARLELLAGDFRVLVELTAHGDDVVAHFLGQFFDLDVHIGSTSDSSFYAGVPAFPEAILA